ARQVEEHLRERRALRRRPRRARGHGRDERGGGLEPGGRRGGHGGDDRARAVLLGFAPLEEPRERGEGRLGPDRDDRRQAAPKALLVLVGRSARVREVAVETLDELADLCQRRSLRVAEDGEGAAQARPVEVLDLLEEGRENRIRILLAR